MSGNLGLALCLIALGAACCFPGRERRRATLCAGMLLCNWLACAWTYTPVSPFALFAIPGTWVWAIADAAFGCFVVMNSGGRWWGCAIWTTAVLQEVAHKLHFDASVSTAIYLGTLDALLLCQVSIFIAGGAKGVGDILHSGAVWLRGLGRPSHEAHALVPDEAP